MRLLLPAIAGPVGFGCRCMAELDGRLVARAILYLVLLLFLLQLLEFLIDLLGSLDAVGRWRIAGPSGLGLRSGGGAGRGLGVNGGCADEAGGGIALRRLGRAELRRRRRLRRGPRLGGLGLGVWGWSGLERRPKPLIGG